MEEKSTPAPCRTPRTVDITTLLKVEGAPHTSLCTVTCTVHMQPALGVAGNMPVVIAQVDKSCVHEVPRKRKSSRRSHYDVRSVDEITEEDLENIAYRSKDKIWDKENVSHSRHSHICCSQVSWVCVVPHCVLVDVPSGQLVSPVQTEDPGH